MIERVLAKKWVLFRSVEVHERVGEFASFFRHFDYARRTSFRYIMSLAKSELIAKIAAHMPSFAASLFRVPVSNPDHDAMLRSADPQLAKNKRFVYDFRREVFEAAHMDLAPGYRGWIITALQASPQRRQASHSRAWPSCCW